ncbi:MAG: hypothetical protein JW904_00685 [Spirochaetales bacterium]|nr:hypothetical protein [Spirochaetales bacterium]
MKLKISVVAIAAILLSAAFVVSCGPQGKYGEVQAVVGEFVAMVDTLDKALDSNDGKTVAAALTAFGNKMKEIQPRLEGLADKYPELDSDKVPAELEGVKKQMDESEKKMESLFEKLMKYADNEDVMKAMAAFEDIK